MWREAEVKIPLSISFLKVLLIAPFNPSPPNRSEANISSRSFRRQYKYANLQASALSGQLSRKPCLFSFVCPNQ